MKICHTKTVYTTDEAGNELPEDQLATTEVECNAPGCSERIEVTHPKGQYFHPPVCSSYCEAEVREHYN